MCLITDLEKLRELALRHSLTAQETELSQALQAFLNQPGIPTALLGSWQTACNAVQALRQTVHQKVGDWQKRERDLQQLRAQAESEPVNSTRPVFPLTELRSFLDQDPVWKLPLRQYLEQLERDLAQLLTPPDSKAGLFSSIKSSLDVRGREQAARQVFQKLQQALAQGLQEYETQLMLALDRQLDDFLDQFPEALNAAGANKMGDPSVSQALQCNRDWARDWVGALRARLQLTHEGGFSNWPHRKDLWIRLPQKPPVTEIRRDLESELIRQLGQNLFELERQWLDRVEPAFKPAAPASEDRSRFIEQWVRQSVLMEQEQQELRNDWSLLQTLEERLKPLRERIHRAISGSP